MVKSARVLEVLTLAASLWTPEPVNRVDARSGQVCELCFGARRWLTRDTALSRLPHGVVHSCVVLIDTWLNEAYESALTAAADEAWRDVPVAERSYVDMPDSIETDVASAKYRDERIVRAAVVAVESEITQLERDIVESRVALYIRDHPFADIL